VSALIAARGADPPATAARQAVAVSDGPWRVVCLGDAEYPSLLSEIYDPPPVLWLQGQITPGPRVAIVGSRRATPYGLRVAREFAAALVATGVTIVSGLARGIDTAAHEGALKSGGRTLAVLGCGLDIAYPPENARLQGTIAEQGAVLSELPPGSAPTAGNFPARNRIISGLCQATLVIEAGERSGALITASQALEQGREVLAVPGNITSLASVGCNRLIVDGARPALSPADVLSALGSANPAESGGSGLDNSGIAAYILPESTAASTTVATRILTALGDDGTSLADLCARTGIAAPELLAALTVLQLSGYVGALPGGRFVSFCQQRR
jgi:DNA processing protein